MFKPKFALFVLAILLVMASFMSSNGRILASGVSTTVAAGDGPLAVAVNPVTNKVYVANMRSDNVTMIDGGDNSTTTVAVGDEPQAVAVNPVTNKVYVANASSGTVTEIDGIDNSTTTVAAGTEPRAVAVNPVTNKVYVANGSSDYMTVITPNRIQSSPLITAIAPLPANTTTTAITTFSFSANSAYTPTAPPVQQIYYQVDTQTGPWWRATPDGASATGDTPLLQPGVHIIFAFATDGQEATSINTGSGSSPIPGQVSAYMFLVKSVQELGAQAEPSFGLNQDLLDGATGLKVSITQATSSVTGSSVAVPLGEFQVQLSYDSNCVKILALRELDFPITAETIDDSGGSATFSGIDAGGQFAPVDLGLGLTRLVGSNQVPCNTDMEIMSLTDDGGNPVPIIPAVLSKTFLRGDARADGTINISDAMFIAQYLEGLRPACTDVIDNTCLHSVNAASVHQDGDFDQVTLTDALFIAQYLEGLRDEFFNLVPSPDVLSELGKGFRLGIGDTAIFESESLELTFLEVSEDSRCPSDVVCVWEGQATIVADLSASGQGLGSFDLTLRAGHEELATQHAGRYRLTLVALEPYPISTHQIEPQEYQATLVIYQAE